MEQNTKTRWPDLSKDQRAWELAKVALGKDAPLTELVQRAQRIKETL
jgi:hypothetical protein